MVRRSASVSLPRIVPMMDVQSEARAHSAFQSSYQRGRQNLLGAFVPPPYVAYILPPLRIECVSLVHAPLVTQFIRKQMCQDTPILKVSSLKTREYTKFKVEKHYPGQIARTFTPASISNGLRQRVNATTACFVAVYKGTVKNVEFRHRSL